MSYFECSESMTAPGPHAHRHNCLGNDWHARHIRDLQIHAICMLQPLDKALRAMFRLLDNGAEGLCRQASISDIPWGFCVTVDLYQSREGYD